MSSNILAAARISTAALAACACLISACTEALPREQPIQEVGDALVRAERASNEAAAAAADAKNEAARQAKLLIELRDLRLRAEESRRSCEASVQRMADAERAREEARKRAQKRAAAAAAAAEAVPTATPEPEKPKDPDYSPSDAPVQ